MLRIHTGLKKLSNTSVYDLHLKKYYPFDIDKPCIIIAKSEVIFEKYRMALRRGKYEIEVQNDDAIKRNKT